MSNSERTPLIVTRTKHERKCESEVVGQPAMTMDRLRTSLLNFYEKNIFLLKAILAIFLAKLYPPLGAEYLHPNITAQWMAVMFIFGMAGILIQTSDLGKAVARCGFNSFVLGFNFFGVSAIVFLGTRMLLVSGLLTEGMADGMIVCSCMPMSVSMVIVFTRMSNGETANATLVAPASSFLSVFLSPLLILSYIHTQTEIDLMAVVIKLLLRVLLPMVIGQLLQAFAQPVVAFVNHNLKALKASQEWALIFIVYTVFCKTFRSDIPAGFMDILRMALFQIVLFLISTIMAWTLLKLLFRDTPRLRAMGVFGCVQKSVAVGIPLIGAIYEHDPALGGLYTLPLLIWHPTQMIIGSIMVPHLAEGVQKLEGFLESSGAGGYRESFFGSKTRVRSRRSSATYNAAIGTVAFDNEEMLLSELNLVDEEERKSLTETSAPLETNKSEVFV